MARTKRTVSALEEGRLTELMDRHGVTFAQLAVSTGVSASYLRRVARGEITNISLDFAMRIAEGLGTTVSDLVDDQVEPDGAGRAPQRGDDRWEASANPGSQLPPSGGGRLGLAGLFEDVDRLRSEGGRAGEFHRRAAARLIQDLLVEAQRLAEGFWREEEWPARGMQVTAYPLVEEYLIALIEELPTGSVALAVVRLDDPEAWARETARVEWDGFNKAIRDRVSEGALRYCRLFFFKKESLASEEVRGELERQRRDGVQVKVWHPKQGERVQDMLLIWTPREGDPREPGEAATIAGASAIGDSHRGGSEKSHPRELIAGKRREWAMQFILRGSGVYEGMMFHNPPESDRDDVLERTFLEYWDMAGLWNPTTENGSRRAEEADKAES